MEGTLRFPLRLLLLCLLASTIHLALSAHLHDDDAEEASSDKYKRDPYDVLRQFSSDERTVRSRHRRQIDFDIDTDVYTIDTLTIELQDVTLDSTIRVTEETELLYATQRLCGREQCSLLLECLPLRYRSYDGRCNNRLHPGWGAVDQPCPRLMPPISLKDADRTQQSARAISRAFVSNKTVFDDTGASQLVMHFGQFIDHDLILTPHHDVSCDCDPSNKPRKCMPIPCANDEVGPKKFCGEEGCLKFARSRAVFPPGSTCDYFWGNPPPKTNPNAITSYLDASNVYGSLTITVEQLRTHEHGRLKMQEGADPNSEEHIHMLPGDDDNEACDQGARPEKCGKGGDIRAAEQPVLTSLHTLFANEHNKIAGKLHTLNPLWSDESLFQEARKIVIAIMQKIVVGEWLPLLIGREAMEKNHLGLWYPYKGYDEGVDATISNEFGAAFFRVGHSMAPEQLKRVNPGWEDTHEDIDLKKCFFNASVVHDLQNGGINSLLLGAMHTKLLAVDHHHSESITKHLFGNIETHGLDLVALNIQRGRDHRLRSFVDYRRFAGLGVLETWEECKEAFTPEGLEALRAAYKTPAEIEPFPGMLVEEHAPGALVGPTLATIIGQQFSKLKHGDRFWFENPKHFTPGQLKTLRTMTLSRVICDTVTVKEIQPAAFKLKSQEKPSGTPYWKLINSKAFPNDEGQLHDFVNAGVSCDDTDAIPKLDIDQWKPTLYTDLPPEFYILEPVD